MRKTIILLLITTIVFTACKSPQSSSPSEGTINFRITYPSDKMTSGFSTFLPSQMKVIYRQNHYKLSIKGEFSIYNLEYISREKGDTCFTLFKIFDKKLFHKMNKNESLFLFTELGNPKIKFDKKASKIIAGHPCKRATLHYPGAENNETEVWYCTDIDLPAANRNTPFEKIPGTLLQFSIKYKDLYLNLEADEVIYSPISADAFNVPESYEQSNPNDIRDLVTTLLQ